MAENDIYNSKSRYETNLKKIESGAYLRPQDRTPYYIRNPENLKYFKILVRELEFRDMSYIRRISFLKSLKIMCYYTKKNLKNVTREDVKDVLIQIQKTHNFTSRREFISYNKTIWKIILPEKDLQGREDDLITPYAWRIKVHNDKSTQTERKDKTTEEICKQIIGSFDDDPRMQLYYSLLYYNLARPQELCYIDIENAVDFGNYARITIASHGKEGIKHLQLIENYNYFKRWMMIHPKRNDPKSPLFVNMCNNVFNGTRMNPSTTNEILRRKLKEIGFEKKLTNYSFKRNNVTHRMLRGEAPQNIQKRAGWSSTDQLRIYDLSNQEDFMEKELIEKGIKKNDEINSLREELSQIKS